MWLSGWWSGVDGGMGMVERMVECGWLREWWSGVVEWIALWDG